MKINEVITEATFYGRQCKIDCSGHQAGYDWANRKGVINKMSCAHPHSSSFEGGCEVAVDQNALRAQTSQPKPRKRLRSKTGQFTSPGKEIFGRFPSALTK